jgi:hypothetical protein
MTDTKKVVCALAEMEDKLTLKLGLTARALAESRVEVAELALAAERGDADAAKKLAGVEKRTAKLATELERLVRARDEAARQLAEQRQAEEAESERVKLRAYVAARERVYKVNTALFAGVEALAPLIAEAHEAGRIAQQAERAAGLSPTREGSAYGVAAGWLRTAFNAVLDANGRRGSKRLEEARVGVSRSWRTTANGKRALDLLAALGDGEDKAA